MSALAGMIFFRSFGRIAPTETYVSKRAKTARKLYSSSKNRTVETYTR